MLLPQPRVTPYLRALAAGLELLAPHGDFVPLAELLVLLEALEPELSGTLLAPAELDPRSGLPALPWVERARAEGGPAQAGDADSDSSDLAIERAYELDPALGARLESRRRLHRFLRGRTLHPGSRLQAVLKRLDGDPCFELSYDHRGADGCWERIRVELRQDPARGVDALVSEGRHGRVTVHRGVRHLLARHAPTTLMALHHQLEQALGGRVQRLSRARVGPFWFPGISPPAELPRQLSAGLTLQISSEVVGCEVKASRHLDPWIPAPTGELVPRGCQVYRERRFCASPSLVPVLEAWGAQRGVPVMAQPLHPRPPRPHRTL
jgi:hypothetical protein